MADLATLQTQLETLRANRARGISRLSISSPVTRRETEFRSDAEIAAAIADIERQIAAQTASAAPKLIYFNTSKGL